MSNGFTEDNPIWDFFAKLGDLVILNLLFLLCSIPLVTIGASYSALYYSMVKSVRKGRGYVVKNFFHAFKQNLIQGIGGFVILVAIGWFSVNGVLAYAAAPSGSTSGQFMLWTSVFITFIVAATACMLFPILSRFAFKFSTLMGLSMVVAFKYLHYSIVFVALAAAIVAGVIYYPFYVIPAVVLIVPALYAYLTSYMMERILKVYQRQIESGGVTPEQSVEDGEVTAEAEEVTEAEEVAEAEEITDAEATEAEDTAGDEEYADGSETAEDETEDNPLLRMAEEDTAEKYVDKWYNE